MILSIKAQNEILSGLESHLKSFDLFIEVKSFYYGGDETTSCFVGATPTPQDGVIFEKMSEQDAVVEWLSCSQKSYYSIVKCSITAAGFPWPMLEMSEEEARSAHDSHFEGEAAAPFSKDGFLALKEIFTSFHQHIADESREENQHYLKKFKYAEAA